MKNIKIKTHINFNREELKKKRLKRGFTVSQLSNLITDKYLNSTISERTIYRIENEKDYNPPFLTMVCLLRTLGYLKRSSRFLDNLLMYTNTKIE